jgi:hypothetical protein
MWRGCLLLAFMLTAAGQIPPQRHGGGREEMTIKEMTEQIIAATIDVRRVLGPGLWNRLVRNACALN